MSMWRLDESHSEDLGNCYDLCGLGQFQNIGWNKTNRIPRQKYTIKSKNARSIYDLMNLNFQVNFRQSY